MAILGNTLVVALLKIGLTIGLLPSISRRLASIDIDPSDQVRNHKIRTKVTMVVVAGMVLVCGIGTCRHL